MAKRKKAPSSRKPDETAANPRVAFIPPNVAELLPETDRGAYLNLPSRFRFVEFAAEELLQVMSSVREEATAEINRCHQRSGRSRSTAKAVAFDVGAYDWQSAANRVLNQVAILETYFWPVQRELELAGTSVQELLDMARSTEKAIVVLQSQKGRWPHRVRASVKHHLDHWRASTQPLEESRKNQMLRSIKTHVRNAAARITPRLRGSNHGDVLEFVWELLNVGKPPHLVGDERAALEWFLQLPANGCLTTAWEQRKIREMLEVTKFLSPGCEVAILDGNHLIIDNRSIVLEEAEADVVTALVELKAADLPTLAKQAGQRYPAKVLTRLVEKYDGLDEFITLPGGRGRGGYSTTIRLAARQCLPSA